MALPSLAGLSLGPPTGVYPGFDDDVHGKILQDLVLDMLGQGELLYRGPVCRAIIAYAKASNAGLRVPASIERQDRQVRLGYTAFDPLYGELSLRYPEQLADLEAHAAELRQGLKLDEDPSFPRDRHKLLVDVELMEYFRERMIKVVSAGTLEARRDFNRLDAFWRMDLEIAVPALLHWRVDTPVLTVVPTDGLFSQRELFDRLYDHILAENPEIDFGAQIHFWRRRRMSSGAQWWEKDILLKFVRIFVRYNAKELNRLEQSMDINLAITRINRQSSIRPSEFVCEILDIIKEEMLVGEQGKRTPEERETNWDNLYGKRMFGLTDYPGVMKNAEVKRKFIELHYMNFLSWPMYNVKLDNDLVLAVLDRFDWYKPNETKETRSDSDSPDEREAKEKLYFQKHELFADVNDRIVQLGLIINRINARGFLANPEVEAKLRQMIDVLDENAFRDECKYLNRKLTLR